MSPEQPTAVEKPVASNNIYTAILAFAFFVVLVTAVLITLKCYFQYNAVFKMP